MSLHFIFLCLNGTAKCHKNQELDVKSHLESFGGTRILIGPLKIERTAKSLEFPIPVMITVHIHNV